MAAAAANGGQCYNPRTMKYRFRPRTTPSQITPPEVYHRRRALSALLALPAAAALPSPPARAATALPAERPSAHTLEARGYEELTPRKKVLSYNNFYELGPRKEEPAENSDLYQPSPWQVSVEGEVHKPRVFGADDLLKLAPMEERVYRLRCVEAWSMVVPWIGYSFSHLADAVQPTGNARYVQFLTFHPDDLFPDDTNNSMPWPYSEGLRMDEAMHPLTLLTFGVYGEVLPTQNGAPIRMIIPWKYGFKSGKALVKIIFTEHQPPTSWNLLQPGEYGFYANVNPEVSHPRWSQASEKAIGSSLFTSRRRTDMFNGFGDEVASLYSGMDLRKFY